VDEADDEIPNEEPSLEVLISMHTKEIVIHEFTINFRASN
jgi:hypothetical protein